MNLETMQFEKEGRIGRLTLNRPRFLNAMNYQGALDLNRAAEMIRDDPIDHVVNGNAFDQEVNALLEKYLRTCSEGTRQSKVLLSQAFDMPHGQFLEEYLRRQQIAMASPDHQEAMAAYREGRDPAFSD